MIMKKQLLLLTMMLLPMMAMMSVLSACSSDDDDTIDINEAAGLWMCTQSKDTYQGKTYDGLLVGAEIYIMNNGTYTSTASTFGNKGTYVLSGNQITAKSSAGTFVVTAKVKGDKMTWDGTSSTGVSFEYVFQREEDSGYVIARP